MPASGAPLVAGLLSLPSPGSPIGDPWFTIMDVLIILTTPLMVGLTVAIQAWAPAQTKVYGSLTVVFTGLLTLVIRSIGIVGYAAVFPVAALLIAVLFHRSRTAALALAPGRC